ncbi:hypothetical protein SK069_17320 [Patulibacter brassicae]|uniref:Type IV secretion system protein n=1 Tax=Patulibacter brassicae TaxID=1705717 RepID=A0ABU4VPU7_9ACTN|nr:hypothetical protein [Patulibacter brassicae]MDX8153362.1 hypothetical protein [Patulibacter brassicae]
MSTRTTIPAEYRDASIRGAGQAGRPCPARRAAARRSLWRCRPRLWPRQSRGPVVAAAAALLVTIVVALAVAPSVGRAASKPDTDDRRSATDDRRSASEPPPLRELTRQALRQSFTPSALLGNDAIGVEGLKPVVARVGRAWETAKRVYLGHPQDPAKARALHEVFRREERREQQMRDDEHLNDVAIASVRMRLMSPNRVWPGESDRQRRTRVATILALDRTTSKDFWAQVAAAKGKTPSTGVKTVCGVITLGPSVLGAVVSVLGSDKGTGEARKLRRACQQTGQRAQDAAVAVGGAAVDFAKDPLGTLARGLFGPLLKELHKATAFAARQVGKGIDQLAAPDLDQDWVGQMLSRSATIAVLIALVAGVLGVIHAALTANLGALASVMARAGLSGVVGSVVLTVLNVAVLFVDQLTTIVLGAQSGAAGKPFQTFADTATEAMAKAQVPSLLALLLMLALLLGLVVVWWEMWLRAPLLYAAAFFYGPAYSASLFPPARQVLGQLNALLAAVVLMPLVVLSLLQMAVASLDGQDSMTAVLQATGLILLAAASPAILVALFSPSVALAAGAGTAAALGCGRSVLRQGRRAGSASLSAVGFARERLAQTRGGPHPDGPASSTGPGRALGPGSGPGGPAGGASQPRGQGPGGGSPGLAPASDGRWGSVAAAGRAGRAPTEEARSDPRTTAPLGPTRSSSQERPDPRDPDHPGAPSSGASGPPAGPRAPTFGGGLDPADATPGRPIPQRSSGGASRPTTGPQGPGPAGVAHDGPATNRTPAPAPRPGTAGLPSPDAPPADPGAASRRPPRRRPGGPPPGGGLTPPTH